MLHKAALDDILVEEPEVFTGGGIHQAAELAIFEYMHDGVDAEMKTVSDQKEDAEDTAYGDEDIDEEYYYVEDEDEEGEEGEVAIGSIPDPTLAGVNNSRGIPYFPWPRFGYVNLLKVVSLILCTMMWFFWTT